MSKGNRLDVALTPLEADVDLTPRRYARFASAGVGGRVPAWTSPARTDLAFAVAAAGSHRGLRRRPPGIGSRRTPRLSTLRSCATKPAPLRRGRDLEIPGNGSEVIEIGDYDEPEFVPHEDYDDE